MRGNKPFWCVWRQTGHVPSFQHETEAGARAEAERIASMNPGEPVYVLEAISVSRKVEVLTSAVEGRELRDLDDIPF